MKKTNISDMYFRDALKLIAQEEPPSFVRGNGTEGYSDDELLQLQDWAADSAKDPIEWSTGIGIIEAAELLVKVAIENGNIRGNGTRHGRV